MPDLPSCQCNAGQPTQQQLANIYCALLDVIANSGGGFTPPLLPSLGGTGVANLDAETITLNGGFPLALTFTGATGVTLPTTGTLATTAQLPTFPISPADGGTGVSNAAGETITLNGGFALQLTLTGATNVTLPTSGTIQVFDQSLNTTDSPAFDNLTVATLNSVNIVNNGGGTLDLQNVTLTASGDDFTLTGALATILNSASAAAPGSTAAIGVPTLVYGNPAVALLAEPDRWGTMDIGGAAFRFPLYAA